jgi:sugar phosphate isomerase/epimerase
MSEKIALQLYSVRDYVAQAGYEATVRKVAEMGYRAVETAGFPGTTAAAAAKLYKELGLTVVAAHTGLPLGERKNEVLETLEALGKPRLVCTQIGRDDVKTLDTVKALCDRLNEGYSASKANGISFGIHNHWWEFGQINGRLAHHLMLEMLDPGIFFEVDTYWVRVGGSDPAEVVKNLGERAPLLHIKDGPANREQPMTAVGDGVMDVPALLKAVGPGDKWLIVELDHCGTDMLEAVKKSYDFLAKL